MTHQKMFRILFLSAAIVGSSSIVATPVLAADYTESSLAAAGVISKSQAIAIALSAVGGGSVIGAVFERQDHIPHWSIDIVGAKYEYEVWVGVTGKVLRVITQPK
jgi:uncharacterized membrane protein YkoI